MSFEWDALGHVYEKNNNPWKDLSRNTRSSSDPSISSTFNYQSEYMEPSGERLKRPSFSTLEETTTGEWPGGTWRWSLGNSMSQNVELSNLFRALTTRRNNFMKLTRRDNTVIVEVFPGVEPSANGTTFLQMLLVIETISSCSKSFGLFGTGVNWTLKFAAGRCWG